MALKGIVIDAGHGAFVYATYRKMAINDNKYKKSFDLPLTSVNKA